MKNITICLLLNLIVFSSCKTSQPNSKDEVNKVKGVIASYFTAIETKNFQQMKENTTPDYLLFESGKVWNNDSLWNDLQNYKEEAIKFRLDNQQVILEQSLAHVSYFNHAEVFQKDSVIRKLDWIENATLKKVNGQWKIVFLHSTVRQ